MFKLITAALVAAAVSAAHVGGLAGAANVTDCGEAAGADVTFTKMAVSPASPSRGQNVSFTATGTTSKEIDGGSGQLKVLINGSPIYSANTNTCGVTTIALPLDLGNVDIVGPDCPVKAGGNVTISGSMVIPVIAPAGTFQVTLIGKDQVETEAYCGQLTLTL